MELLDDNKNMQCPEYQEGAPGEVNKNWNKKVDLMETKGDLITRFTFKTPDSSNKLCEFRLPNVERTKEIDDCASAYSEERGYYDRMILEYCCGEDSLMSTPRSYTKGCKFVRLTESIDMTTDEGLDYALKALQDPVARDGKVLLWSAIPCTGGSTWNRFNWSKGNLQTKILIQGHWKIFNKLFKTSKFWQEKSFDLEARLLTNGRLNVTTGTKTM
jgi:hypothetical protein